MKSNITTNVMTTTAYFVSNYYEVTGTGSVTKYYYAGSQRIALRKDGTLSYLLGDHLGSTSLVTDANGQNSIVTMYKAWGEERYTTPNTTLPTKYTFTGQYSYTGEFGLMFYNARWYDSSLGRFAQADTVVPDAGNSQAYDRYAYTLNNPIRYIDPSGHSVDCGIGDPFCSAGEYTPSGLMMLYDVYMPRTKSCYNCMEKTEKILAQQSAMMDVLSKDIDSYLRTHPNYDPHKDKRLKGRLSQEYGDLRQRYWEGRVEEAGLCGNAGSYCTFSTASALHDYYDNHQTIWASGWDSSRVNWPSVTLDAVGIPLGFVGMGGPLKFGKLGTQALQVAGAVDSAASFESARRSRDGVGIFLSVMSAVPLVGGFFSAIALGRDLGSGNYQYEWTPPIPR